MANYGKYYIAVRLLLLKQYLEANAGRNRIVKRRELEQLLEEHDMPVEKKTLYADFAALGDVCGLQLEYVVPQNGHHLGAERNGLDFAVLCVAVNDLPCAQIHIPILNVPHRGSPATAVQQEIDNHPIPIFRERTVCIWLLEQ